MAHTTQSQVIQDQDDTPIVKTNQLEKGGVKRSAFGYLTLTAATVGQTSAFARIPVRARVAAIKPFMATMGNGSVKIGLHRPNDGIAVKSDAFSSAMALTAKTGANAMDAIAPADLAKSIEDAFETEIGTAGATGDGELDVVLTVVTASTGAATAVGIEVEYVLPE